MNPSIRRHGRLVLATVGLLLLSLLSPVHAQDVKKGKPAPEIYAGIIVKYKSTSAAKATATSATTMRAVEEPYAGQDRRVTPGCAGRGGVSVRQGDAGG